MKSNGHSEGFSLLEMLIALGIFSFVMTAVISFYVSSSRSYTSLMAKVDLQETLRAGTMLMVRDLRIAGLDPLQSGNFGFEEARSEKVRFTADRGDPDGEVDNADQERLTYFFDDRQIKQIRYEGTGSAVTYPLVDNVTQCRFTYLDHYGDDLGSPVDAADLGSIQSVRIEMAVAASAGRGTVALRNVVLQAFCRNMALMEK